MNQWGLGIGPNPQSPIPNPQSPIPIHFFIKNIFKIIYLLYTYNLINNKKYL